MYRTSTPTHIFTFPFAVSGLNWAEITYSQNGTKKLQKDDMSEFTLDGNTLSYTLTQTETKAFSEGMYELQVRCGRTASEVLVSNMLHLTADQVLDDSIHE